MARNIVQLNNRYIQDENQHRRYLEHERRKKNRVMGWVLILVILLFILPTFNLVQSYRNLLERRTQLTHLQKRYEEISNEKESQKAFANKLKDEEYAAKYARAKYYYSKQGEYIYTIPGLLPQ